MEKKLVLVNATTFERMFWLVKDIMGYLTEEQRKETYVFWSQNEMKIQHITIKFITDHMSIKGYVPDACFGFTNWKMRDKEYPGTLMDYLDDELNCPPIESEG